jgi:hypothetical protein
VADRADAADAGHDGLDVIVAATPNHRFKEPRRFGNLPFAFFNRPVSDIDHDIAVALDAGNMMDININICTHKKASVLLSVKQYHFLFQVIDG